MTTSAAGNVTEFTTVDRAPDSSWFIEFMDMANAVPEYASIRQSLADNLGPLDGARLLDVGCGTGDDARELAERVGPAGAVLGVDLSDAMIAEARRRAGGAALPAEFRVGDVRRLGFADGSFDGVRAKLVLMHCADIEAAAAELVRVLRPGGRLAVFDYDFDLSAIDHPDMAATREVVRCCADGHPNSWSGRQLARRFLDLGLRDISVTPHTVIMPYSFFRRSVGGRLAAACADGSLRMTAAELDAWWRELADAEARGRFFSSLTGFVVGGTR
ncbi:methyltransferase domain-containing protein [Gandjariella thermophila]|uniref:Methyltransferase n=1 Tax=Gandjariella thermophila TaxID=1931992 RepID=A0A4D4J7J2_9PSEU|nr:methyltransferase domain-containing protein [Gandjariella thermophila]GDY32765.1 methyltransferase [Gandjariella thermophila]